MHDKFSRRNCEAYKFFIIAELFHSFYSVVDGIAEKSVHIARLHFGKNCAVGNTGELYALVAARETLFHEDDIRLGVSGMHRTVVPRNERLHLIERRTVKSARLLKFGYLIFQVVAFFVEIFDIFL